MRTFKNIGLLEAISYLTLLLIAMPLKYIWGMDDAVKYTGWAHGVLFISYVVILFITGIKYKWSFKLYFLGFIASLLPFGPIVFDKKYLE